MATALTCFASSTTLATVTAAVAVAVATTASERCVGAPVATAVAAAFTALVAIANAILAFAILSAFPLLFAFPASALARHQTCLSLFRFACDNSSIAIAATVPGAAGGESTAGSIGSRHGWYNVAGCSGNSGGVSG